MDREDSRLAHRGSYLLHHAVDEVVDPEVSRRVEGGHAGDAMVRVKVQLPGLRRIDVAVLLVGALAGLEFLRHCDLVPGKDESPRLPHGQDDVRCRATDLTVWWARSIRKRTTGTSTRSFLWKSKV